MLEEREYKKSEIAKILHTTENQGIKRKLNNYGIEYSCSGRGRNLQIQIIKIPSLFQFRIFCITELNVAPQTDFRKFRNFLYYFMNDEDFRWLPDETIEIRLREKDIPVSRQTISNYKRNLEAANLISLSTGNTIVYYFAKNHQQRIVDKAEYLSAWHEYWENKEKYNSSRIAAQIMREKYGGMARKQYKAEINGILFPVWEKLNDLVCGSIELELCTSNSL